MLSFLQERLGRSPTKPQDKMTRQESIVSAFSRVNARNGFKDASSTPSLTTGTSMTDSSSELTDSSAKQENLLRSSARSRASIGSYNENVLSGQRLRSVRKQVEGTDNVIKAAKPLVHSDDNESRERLLQQSVQALDEDWKLGAMPGDGLKASMEEEGGAKKRRSTRLDLLEQASHVIEKTTGVLGKRGRETMEAGLEKIQSLASSSKRPKLEPGASETTALGSPKKKRARFSAVDVKDEESPEAVLKRKTAPKSSKLWLSQGLYVGQDPEFNPRLTESKNKMKKASAKQSHCRRNSSMPLPIFAGERTLSLGRDFKLPFDVFSPLPPGQPKPDEWKKTHKNVFIGDAVNIWKKAKPQEYSTCICTAETGCDDDCQNRFMLYECDDSNCNVGAKYCTNRAFADLKKRSKAGGKYRVGVEVMKTIDRGYGVRANRTFDPNQIIVEYTGEIITQDECDERMNKRYKDAECYYLMDFDQSMVLDATRGSIARFINHSCAPNCRMIKWTVSGKPRMALFAGDRGIMTGEELTYDYNFDPFSAKNVQECRCGAEGCRGVLGPKPKEIKEALRSITAGGKRKFQQVVEDAVETVTKKRKLAVPSSVKAVFATAKASTSRRLSQAKILTATPTRQERLVKKASERSLKGLQRKTTEEQIGGKKRRHTIITYTRRRASIPAMKSEKTKGATRRRQSTSALVPDEKRVDDPSQRNSLATGKEAKGATPKGPSKRDSVRARAANATANVVRTVRRSDRGMSGKTIRVIGDDEFKGWR